MTNRDRPASTLTKREEAALRISAAVSTTVAADRPARTDEVVARAVVGFVDALFDALDTPLELREVPEPDWSAE